MGNSYTLFDPANRTAKWLLECGAVEFRPEQPFIYTSGRKSPIYVDARKLLGVSKARAEITMMACGQIFRVVGSDRIDYVAGGETAGIPFATMIAERMMKPLCYIRKQPKGFGHNAQIECLTDEQLGQSRKVILIEDLCTDGGSKRVFIDAVRRTANVITDVFAVFSYGCFDAAESLAGEGVRLISLSDAATLIDVADDLDWSTQETRAEIRRFLDAPDVWQNSEE